MAISQFKSVDFVPFLKRFLKSKDDKTKKMNHVFDAICKVHLKIIIEGNKLLGSFGKMFQIFYKFKALEIKI